MQPRRINPQRKRPRFVRIERTHDPDRVDENRQDIRAREGRGEPSHLKRYLPNVPQAGEDGDAERDDEEIDARAGRSDEDPAAAIDEARVELFNEGDSAEELHQTRRDRKSTRLNSSHRTSSRMPPSA